jgi:hypothetical protein
VDWNKVPARQTFKSEQITIGASDGMCSRNGWISAEELTSFKPLSGRLFSGKNCPIPKAAPKTISTVTPDSRFVAPIQNRRATNKPARLKLPILTEAGRDVLS